MRPKRQRLKFPHTIEKCGCARTTTTYRSAAMRPVEHIIGKPDCLKCKGAGLTQPCAVCEGAGLRAGSTFAKPITCEICSGSGRVPWEGALHGGALSEEHSRS